MVKPLEELNYCIEFWGKQGYCTFGGRTNCEACGTPYILLKLFSGEILHGKGIARLTLVDWRKKVESLEKVVDGNL